MEDIAAREAQLRRQCRKVGLLFKKSRRGGRGAEHGPYHALEPVTNLALSAAWYPNGMTLDEAEALSSNTQVFQNLQQFSSRQFVVVVSMESAQAAQSASQAQSAQANRSTSAFQSVLPRFRLFLGAGNAVLADRSFLAPCAGVTGCW